MNDNYINLSATEHYITKLKGDFIFMDVKTLNVYILNEIENAIIKEINKQSGYKGLYYLKKKYGESIVLEKIDELLRNDILKKNKEINEDNAKDPGYDEETPETINSIDVLLSEDCNLACKYCFVKKGHYRHKTALMQPDVGEKTVDFLIQKSGKKNDLFLCFFGGEPLMNFRVMGNMVIYALEEGRKNNKYFHFSLTTNGTLLSDEVVEFISKHQISVLISIDGDISSHNLNRPFPGGGDSYDKIVGNLQKLNQHGISFSARATVTSFTKNKIAENYEHLISLGFKRIHFENALAPTGRVFINNKSDIEEIKKQYSLISKKIIETVKSGQPYNVESFPLPLERIASKRLNFYSCTAGKGYISVDVNGDIYLCHRLVGEKSFYSGNVFEDNFNDKWSEIIRNDVRVDNRIKCRKCWARYICGGGCYEVNYNFNKDISLAPRIYCQLMKHSIKLAITIYAEAAQ
jgi:uncharacterized protein